MERTDQHARRSGARTSSIWAIAVAKQMELL
jgi:hypothetical protein